jgi:CBS domain-containing protein
MLEATMGTLVTYNPKAVMPDTTFEELQAIMEQLQVRHLPVIDEEHRIVGLVSERDLARAKYNAAVTAMSGKRSSIDTKRVEQIMARQVMTLEQFESPEIALRAMVAHAFHSVPVTDGGRLVGMITSSDFLREFSYGQWPGHDELVRRRMGSPGHTVDADATLERVLEVTEEHSQEFIVVVRRYRPLGILSRTSLRQCLYADGDEHEMTELRTTPVRLLLANLPALSCDQPLGKSAGQMLEYRARALPVVDRSRMLLGVLQEDDILRTIIQRLDEVGA